MLLFNPYQDSLLSFRPVEGNEISFSSLTYLKKDQAIVVVEPFDLTEMALSLVATGSRWSARSAAMAEAATAIPAARGRSTRLAAAAAPVARRAAAAAARAAAVSVAAATPVAAGDASATVAWMAWKEYDMAVAKAKDKFVTTGKIEGFKALIVGSNQLVWISQFDVAELEKENDHASV